MKYHIYLTKKSVTAVTTMTKEQGMLLCDILVSFKNKVKS